MKKDCYIDQDDKVYFFVKDEIHSGVVQSYGNCSFLVLDNGFRMRAIAEDKVSLTRERLIQNTIASLHEAIDVELKNFQEVKKGILARIAKLELMD